MLGSVLSSPLGRCVLRCRACPSLVSTPSQVTCTASLIPTLSPCTGPWSTDPCLNIASCLPVRYKAASNCCLLHLHAGSQDPACSAARSKLKTAHGMQLHHYAAGSHPDPERSRSTQQCLIYHPVLRNCGITRTQFSKNPQPWCAHLEVGLHGSRPGRC